MVIEFHDDLPIQPLYKKVVAKLDSILENKDVYMKEYSRYKKIADSSHNPEDRQAAHIKHHRMEKIVEIVRDSTLVEKFREKASPMVDEYRLNQGNGYMFGANTRVNIPKRVAIITRFMNMVNEFIDIEWTCTFNMDDVCPKCYTYMEKRSNVMVCCKCKSCYAIDPTKPMSSDPSDVVKESTYKSSKNYRKEFLHLCGLQNSCEADQVGDIESYIYRSGIKVVTRGDIRAAIPRCGFKNYNDTNYIYTEITKEPLPPISEHMAVCTARFEKYYMEFDREHPKGNITNLHLLTKLFLFQEDVHTEEDWFRKLSPKTEARHRSNIIGILSILKNKYPENSWKYPAVWDTELLI